MPEPAQRPAQVVQPRPENHVVPDASRLEDLRGATVEALCHQAQIWRENRVVWQHEGNAQVYVVYDVVPFQCSSHRPLDGESMVLYRDVIGGGKHCRTATEFFDGRFRAHRLLLDDRG